MNWPVEGAAGDIVALQACYDDLAKAMAFVSALMVDLMNNDPAVAEATIQAITKTGYALPLLGVTNGTPAVAPQVGQYVQFSGSVTYPSTGVAVRELLSLGVLPAGDWDCWLWATSTSLLQGTIILLAPLPAGFAANPTIMPYSGTIPPTATLNSMTVEALTSADEPIVADTQAVGTSGQGGTLTVNFAARRRR